MYFHSTLAGRHCIGINLLYRLTVYVYESFLDLLRGASREKEDCNEDWHLDYKKSLKLGL